MKKRTYTFHDARLRSLPLRLLNLLGSGAQKAGLRLPDLSAQAVLDEALRRTGLSDTGAADFREALASYTHSAEHDADLNTLGRLAVRNMLVNALANRLQVVDWVKRHPELQRETIHQPWVVVGLPRTGTSLLSILLGLDPECRPLLQWETARPMPPADLAGAGEDVRIAAYAGDVKRLMRLNPTLAAMHPFGSLLAEECTAVFMYALRTIGMETIAFVPGYGEWLARADMKPAYAMHKQVLQALQNALPTERWVLKSPNHLWSLDSLVATYPDARIVWTHRDPGAVVASLASLNNAMQLPFTRRHDPRRVADYWADKLNDGISRASAFDSARPAGWCQHVHYDDLLADPIAAVESIYRSFGATPSPLHRRRMAAWLQKRPQDVAGRHVYDVRDFGWTQAALQQRYRDYRQRYAIRSAF